MDLMCPKEVQYLRSAVTWSPGWDECNIFIIGWGMVNDMEMLHNFFPPAHYILDMQLVAKRLGYVNLGLKSMIKELFGVEIDKKWQKWQKWHLRPLPYEAKLCKG